MTKETITSSVLVNGLLEAKECEKRLFKFDEFCIIFAKRYYYITVMLILLHGVQCTPGMV